MAYEGPHPFPIASGGTNLTVTRSIVQIVQATSSTHQATTALTVAIPADDTIPQSNEGIEHLTVSITPTKSTNILYIVFSVFTSTNTEGGFCTWALFQDSTANALYTTVYRGLGSGTITSFFPLTGNYTMTAGTTSATTFKLRFGPQTPATITDAVNGNATTQFFGGVCRSTIQVMELEA